MSEVLMRWLSVPGRSRWAEWEPNGPIGEYRLTLCDNGLARTVNVSFDPNAPGVDYVVDTKTQELIDLLNRASERRRP